MASGMTLSSMSPIRNPQRPLSTPLLDPPHSWHTYNWDINTKFSGYLPWDKKTSFMTTGMTMSSMGLVRNPQRPPSTPLLDTLLIDISTQNFQGIFFGVKNLIHDVRNDHFLHVSGQDPSKSSKCPPSWHTSDWDINTNFFCQFNTHSSPVVL